MNRRPMSLWLVRGQPAEEPGAGPRSAPARRASGSSGAGAIAPARSRSALSTALVGREPHAHFRLSR